MTSAKAIVTNNDTSVQFGISKNSAKLFSMLSTSLYSSKEVAVMYEIGANCVDAHSLNGNQSKPWDLTLPTNQDAVVKFRDYGPGLSDEDVVKLLTTYGESTKSTNDAMIGSYGIGSKSPAAVSSSWTVISRFNNKKSEYLIIIDDDGIPTLSKIRTDKCDDTGLEVIIPVNPNRVGSWRDNVVSTFRYYDVKPNLINYVVTWPEVKKLHSGDCWDLLGQTHYNSSSEFIISQRAYKFDANLLENEFRQQPFVALFRTHAFHIKFAPGEIETSLSRESIQYTSTTLKNISTNMSKLWDSLQLKVSAILKGAKDGLEYRQRIFTVAEEVFGSKKEVRSVFKFIKNNRYNVVHEDDLHTFRFEVKDFTKTPFKVFNGDSKISTLNEKFKCWGTWNITCSYPEWRNLDLAELKFKILALDKVKIIIDDVRGTTSRVRHDPSCKGHAVLIAAENIFPKELQRFIIPASALKKPPRGIREKKTDKSAVVLWKIYKNSFVKVDEKIIDKKNPIVGFFFKDARAVSSVDADVESLIPVLRPRLGVTLIGVKEGSPMPKYVVPINTFVDKEIARLNTTMFVDKFNAIQLKTELINSWAESIKCLRKMDIRTPHKSVWNELKDVVTSIETTPSAAEVSSDYRYLVQLTNVRKVELNASKVLESVDNISTKLYDTYHMMRYVDRFVTKDDLLEYINLVGK